MLNLTHESFEDDFCTQAGARKLAAMIEAYWADRGYDVKISYQSVGFVPAMRSARVDIRSNLVNGMPRHERHLQLKEAA